MNNNDSKNSDAYFVTKDGLAKLEDDLAQLKKQRPEIAESLRVAMQDKDFRENAPLDAARDAQAHLEAKIRNIETQLRNAVIVSAEEKQGKAHVGSKVTLLNIKKQSKQIFELVTQSEVDPKNGKISIESPVGVAVSNHIAGDEVIVNTPSGDVKFQLIDVVN
ncbi:MAG: transcription elongation factor GreA [Dehalococcoidia bacterium]|nr:transcription elongation factor GreA [Dehalococcoidia bacterium]